MSIENLDEQELATVTGGFRTPVGRLLDDLATPSNPQRTHSTPPSPTRLRARAAVPDTLRRTNSATAVPNILEYANNSRSFRHG
jgi:bacteriocin-like protein